MEHQIDNHWHEECGVFGVMTRTDEACGITYNALLALQHRGQEGAGIAALKNSSIPCIKNIGLVSEVFTAQEREQLPDSHAAIGHVRYSTTGNNTRANVQPIVKEYLEGRIAVEVAAAQLKGAFSLLVLSSTNQLIAVRDVEPGEMIIVNGDGTYTSQKILKKDDDKEGLCIFEYVYFARADSVINGLSVYQARFNMGVQLAREYPVDADIVCGVPDSGLDSAAGYAYESGIPCVAGFVKNRYIGRSFIFPSQAQRDAAVRLKLNPLEANVRGKRVVLIDDSIVRGTTSAKIIRSLKQAGAREVHMRVSSPPFRHTCHFGTDIDSEENLIANRMSLEEIARSIGADSLGYISCHGLKEACKDSRRTFCTGCFTGDYPVAAYDQRKVQFEN